MTGACVAFAVASRLDVAAVRRLADYAGLDDAGVTSAFEQARVQHGGGVPLANHLRVITRLAAVIDDGHGVRLLAGDAESGEAAALQELAMAWPVGSGQLVIWANEDAALLSARAFMHALPMGSGLGAWPRFAVAEHVLAAPAEDEHTEAELARLTGLDAGGEPALSTDAMKLAACNRYRWWLRWQYVHARIDAATRQAREAALLEQCRMARAGAP